MQLFSTPFFNVKFMFFAHKLLLFTQGIQISKGEESDLHKSGIKKLSRLKNTTQTITNIYQIIHCSNEKCVCKKKILFFCPAVENKFVFIHSQIKLATVGENYLHTLFSSFAFRVEYMNEYLNVNLFVF